jgi:hypothetical protein
MSRSNSSTGCGLLAQMYWIVASRETLTRVASWPGNGDWSAATASECTIADIGNSA